MSHSELRKQRDNLAVQIRHIHLLERRRRDDTAAHHDARRFILAALQGEMAQIEEKLDALTEMPEGLGEPPAPPEADDLVS